MLVTEGKEQKILREVLATKDGINMRISKSNEINNALYKECPRLVPPEYNPQCAETHIELPTTQAEPSKSKKKGNKTAKSKDNKKTTTKTTKKVRFITYAYPIHYIYFGSYLFAIADSSAEK